MNEIGVGILGAGGIAATSHLPEIAAVNGLRVVNICGRKQARLQRLQEQFDVPRSCNDWDALITDDEVQAVVIALPHPLHAEAALKVLNAGKHLLMTKPLCATIAEADALVAACEAHPELCVFIRPDFGPVDYAIRDHIAVGKIGKISGGEARYSHGGPEIYYAGVAQAFGEELDKDNLWFFDSQQASVGALFDMGVYCVSKIVAAMGRAVKVMAHLSTLDKPTELDDGATIMIQFEHGAIGTATTSWCDPARSGYLHVHGTKGKLWAPGSGDSALDFIEPSSYTDENAKPITHHINLGPGENQHAEWLRCIRDGIQPQISNIWFSRHVTEILLAAMKSHELGSWVSVNSSPEPQSI